MTSIIKKHNAIFSLDLPIRVAANNANLKNYIDTFRYNRMETDTALPQEVTAVLNEHGKTCSVNGNLIVRGSEVSSYALQLINICGHEELLNIADAYCSTSQYDSCWLRTRECETAIQQHLNERKDEIHNRFNETQRQILNEILHSIDNDVAHHGEYSKKAKIYQSMLTPVLDEKRKSQLARWDILDMVMTIRSIVIDHDTRQGDVSFLLQNNNGNNVTVADIALYMTAEISERLRNVLSSSWIATEKVVFIDMCQHRSNRHALEMEDFFGIDFEEVGMEKPVVDFMTLQHDVDFKTAKEKIAASVEFNTTHNNIQRKLFKAVRAEWENKNQAKINALMDKASKELANEEKVGAAWDSVPAYTERRVDPKPIVDAATAKQEIFEKKEAELMDRLHTAVVNKNRKEAKEIRSHFDMSRSIFHDLKKKWRHDHKHETSKVRSNKMK
jgi:hypothetical protein